MKPRIIALGIVLLLVAAVVAPVAAQSDEITFVFISETGNEYSYTLLGPESNTWIGSVHANGSEVITGPPGLYGYILDGPDGNQFSGHIALLADGRAEVIFDDFSVTERVDKRAPSTEPGAAATAGTVSDLATFVFTSHTGTEYTYTLLGPESNVWVGAVHRRGSSTVQGPAGLYGYTLQDPSGNQRTGHITLAAGGRAELVFNDLSLTENVANPVAEGVGGGGDGDIPGLVNYTVLPGDNLTKIAKKFNVDPLVIAAGNGIRDANVITPGQVLVIRVDQYSVRPGDNLARIARLFGVSLDDLVTLNNIGDPNLIFIGQQLDIPK